MSALSKVPPMPQPARCLVLVDGNAVLPERSNLLRGAQGGGLASYSMHENLRRAISQQCGRDCQGLVAVFADIPQLATALRIPHEVLTQFSRGFSSTAAPSTFVNVMHGSTLSTMNAHLVFHAPAVDYVVLVGWTTDMHAHWLSNLVPTTFRTLSNFYRVETAAQPCAASLAKLVPKLVRFQGLMDAVSVSPMRDITDPPSDHEEGVGIDHDELGASPPAPTAKKTTNGTSATAALATSARQFTSALLARSGLTPTPSPSPSATPTAARTSFAFRSVPAPSTSAPSLSRRDTTSSSGHSAVTVSAAAAPQPVTSGPMQVPGSSPSIESSSMASSPESMLRNIPGALPASPPRAAEPSPPPPAPVALAPPPPPPPTAPIVLPRPPTVPQKYRPLLRILLALQPAANQPTSTTAAPPPPLWSAVGTHLQREGALPPGKGKLAALLAQAQKDGWVNLGKGDNEGSEWVRISARGRRAMGKA
ncbi:hypothetical protein JCM8208_003467 [Rhodotorula glutinis]